MNFYTTSLLLFTTFYILLLVIVFFFQRSLLYHPSVNNYVKSEQLLEPSEIKKVKINTSDNIELIAWFYNKDLNKFKTIVFFHTFASVPPKTLESECDPHFCLHRPSPGPSQKP